MLFFYCKRDQHDKTRQNPDEVLRSIVRQLVYLKPGTGIGKSVRSCYNSLKKAGMKLSIQGIVKLIGDPELLSTYRSMTIVIDASDECRDSDTSISDLLTQLRDIMMNPQCLVKVLISSKKPPKMDFLMNPRNYPLLPISAGQTVTISNEGTGETKYLVSQRTSQVFSIPVKNTREDVTQIIEFMVLV